MPVGLLTAEVKALAMIVVLPGPAVFFFVRKNLGCRRVCNINTQIVLGYAAKPRHTPLFFFSSGKILVAGVSATSTLRLFWATLQSHDTPLFMWSLQNLPANACLLPYQR